MRVLGVSGFYHDAAACLVDEGRLVAAAEEERFSRVKHDSRLPVEAMRYCLTEGGVAPGDVDVVAFYDKPILKLHRILETALAVAPAGYRRFARAVPEWLREKLWVEPMLREAVADAGFGEPGRMVFLEHHESHAASAFFPSPFQSAAVLTLDGVGEWASATVAHGRGGELTMLEQLDFPHSPGLLYSAFTAFCGFKVNGGEYKLMGLAPYGEGRYTARILDEVVSLKDDGSFRLNLDVFGFLDGDAMTNDRFARLFDGPPRRAESPIGRRECDLARSVQEVIEEIVLRMARHARQLTGEKHLCLAGGVALNCVANGRLLRAGVFDDLWIQPAAGDSGGAVGAALGAWHRLTQAPRQASTGDAMNAALLGPEFPADEIRAFLDARGYPYRELPQATRAEQIARLVADQQVVGLFQGRMEFGPRALGNRSIIADPRSPRMQSTVNLKVKFRESFRPFAPAVLEEKAAEWFDLDRPSPYMLVVAQVASARRLPVEDDDSTDLIERVNRPRSTIPAVTHVDGSARVQTVSQRTHPAFHEILSAFDRLTGCPVLVNTSFNVRGEPIVCTPEDAYRCFMGSAIDCLVLGPFLLQRSEQPAWTGPSGALALD